MGRIRMAVEIRNESPATLVWDRDEVASGGWTAPWFPSRTATIAAGATAEWRCEGDLALVPTSGAEARAWYSVDGDRNRQLYVHVNSPLVESQYGNTFHVWAPPEFEVSHSGGQGHEARLVIRFRESARRSVPGFTPSVNGFQFSNAAWDPKLPAMTVGFLWNRLLDRMGADAASQLGIGRVDDNWLPFTHANAGLCGGMAFGVMDYFAAGEVPPQQLAPPTSADDELFRFLRDRLFDSFDVLGQGYRWLGYSSPHYPNGDEGVVQAVGLTRGRSWVTYRDEWPRIRDDIDNGQLSPIGLIQTDELDLGKNHQILGYAYQQRGQIVHLSVYDPNIPREDGLGLEFDITDTSGEVSITRLGYQEPGSKIFAMIRTNGYVSHAPPGGRPLTVRQALRRTIGHGDARLPADIGLSRPASLRNWLASV